MTDTLPAHLGTSFCAGHGTGWLECEWWVGTVAQISIVHTDMYTRYSYKLYTEFNPSKYVSATNRQYQADVNKKEYLRPALFGTRKLFTAFTGVRHFSLLILSIIHHSISWRSNLKLFSHLRLILSSCLLPLVSPPKLCIKLPCLPYVSHAPHILFLSIRFPD